jgi:hypothetical protein
MNRSVIYKEGNLFENIKGKSNIIICHVANDIGGWGSGFVIPLAKAFPKARQNYLEWFKNGTDSMEGSFTIGKTQFVEMDDIVVANMIAQHKTGSPPRCLRYNALAKCMDEVADFATSRSLEIHAPLFGAGLAGGNFAFIAELIEDCWVRKDIPVTIHYLPGEKPESI